MTRDGFSSPDDRRAAVEALAEVLVAAVLRARAARARAEEDAASRQEQRHEPARVVKFGRRRKPGA
jgi:hypothetical protein